MKVKIKKLHPDAVIPKYAKSGDAGLDLVAVNVKYDNENDLYMEYGTGISMEIPEGYVGLIFPRSSISNSDLTLANATGVIDSGYRGEIKLRFKASCEFAQYVEDRLGKPRRDAIYYQIGDKIGQMIILPYPQVEFEETEELSQTERGASGYGSTGK
jgi:dUTP pyrophosphatase